MTIEASDHNLFLIIATISFIVVNNAKVEFLRGFKAPNKKNCELILKQHFNCLNY